MIGKLTGVVDTIDAHAALIDVGGVGYVATCSTRTLACLKVGERAALVIETVVREDAIQLFGFSDAVERTLFRLMLTVQGVGPKAALAVLGAVAIKDLLQAIATADRRALTRAPGVGAKLAARIVSELADRIGKLGLAAAPGAPADHPAAPALTRDAISALVNLGFRATEAADAITRASAGLGQDARLEALVRGGLGLLAAREQPTPEETAARRDPPGVSQDRPA
jgi:Holliday junction DNA helicase RuvA